MGGSQKINPQPIDSLRPEFRGTSGDLASFANNWLKRGNGVAGLSPGESGAVDAAGNLLSTGGYLPMGSDYMSRILGGANLSPSSNPGLQGNIDYLTGQSQRALGTNMNMLDAAFAKTGMGYSGPRSTAATALARQSGDDLNGQISQLIGNNYQLGLQQQMQALGLLPQMQSAAVGSLSGLMPLLGMPRQITQQGLNQPMTDAQQVMQLIAGVPGIGYSQPQYAPSNFAQILGALSGAGGSFMSALPFLMA